MRSTWVNASFRPDSYLSVCNHYWLLDPISVRAVCRTCLRA